MLFNSYQFIFFFLPITLTIYYLLGARKRYWGALLWLVLASLVFYGWWNPAYLVLILSSAIFNYLMGRALLPRSDGHRKKQRVGLLVVGVGANIVAIAYFKYANFFVDNANTLLGSNFHLDQIVLPLAISFFTFQQITYLVDAYTGDGQESTGDGQESSFLKYCLFVTFFPQLIAGPIVHHKEMIPQFSNRNVFRFHNDRLAIGLTIFSIGLLKKTAIADGVAVYSTPVFDAALSGFSPTFFEAWGAALAYTFQLYFDFSGYSDMAVGLAYMFGICLPLNFFSPYKAVNIIEFWRRWHISLSRFLRDYVYIPLGGNRNGSFRRFQYLLITMLLGGLWHGAGWTFVAWGALHGAYLIINHLWRGLRIWMGQDLTCERWWGRFLSQVVTFLAVVVGWVIFRAESFPAAISILLGMSGTNGFALPPSYLNYLNHLFQIGDWLAAQGWIFAEEVKYFGGVKQVGLLALLLMWTWFVPNTYQIMGKNSPALDISSVIPTRRELIRVKWVPSMGYALLVSFMLFIALNLLDSTSEFLYFQF